MVVVLVAVERRKQDGRALEGLLATTNLRQVCLSASSLVLRPMIRY